MKTKPAPESYKACDSTYTVSEKTQSYKCRTDSSLPGVGDEVWGRELSVAMWLYGEGNGTPLQCSCLENPRDGGAWWAAVSGVAQSRTRLKRLSSRSGSMWL